MPVRRLLSLIAVAAAAAALVGCSGSSADRATPRVGKVFAARATDACQKALESKQSWSDFPVASFDPAHPDRSALPKAARWLEEQVAPTFEGWLRDLQALGTPPTGAAAWTDVLTAVAQIVKGNADEITAAQTGDTGRFAAAHDRLEQAQSVLERATSAAGVPKCAEVHKSS